ncbi:ATP-binding protein [Actinomadura sp. 7K507]|uniref:ATP-binding protein n=1 Tax=Actinomadura sp. 7K507 TaxID=2530365 RepID=UPI001042D2C1|nr:ATP-binding protein [Actinomadura sp. 7K507]TDC79429.1 ATP-binding protein [Actinomadura sp. 7K507]
MSALNANVDISGELDITCVPDKVEVGRVRSLVDFQLGDWGLSRMAADMCLIASELVTNALECAPGREIRVRLRREPEGVLLGVWDPSDEMPVVHALDELTLADVAPDPDALDPGHEAGTCGRGLPIVEALSSEWQVEKTAPHGKWVWSRIVI